MILSMQTLALAETENTNELEFTGKLADVESLYKEKKAVGALQSAQTLFRTAISEGNQLHILKSAEVLSSIQLELNALSDAQATAATSLKFANDTKELAPNIAGIYMNKAYAEFSQKSYTSSATDYKKAAEFYTRLDKLPFNYFKTLHWLAKCQFADQSTGQPSETLKIISSKLDKYGGNDYGRYRIYFDVGKTFVQNDDVASGTALWKDGLNWSLTLSPSNTTYAGNFLITLADESIEQFDWPATIQYAHQASELFKNEPKTRQLFLTREGRALIEERDYEKALKLLLESRAAVDEKELPNIARQLDTLIGSAYMWLGEIAEAQKFLTAASTLETPNNVDRQLQFERYRLDLVKSGNIEQARLNATSYISECTEGQRSDVYNTVTRRTHFWMKGPLSLGGFWELLVMKACADSLLGAQSLHAVAGEVLVAECLQKLGHVDEAQTMALHSFQLMSAITTDLESKGIVASYLAKETNNDPSRERASISETWFLLREAFRRLRDNDHYQLCTERGMKLLKDCPDSETKLTFVQNEAHYHNTMGDVAGCSELLQLACEVADSIHSKNAASTYLQMAGFLEEKSNYGKSAATAQLAIERARKDFASNALEKAKILAQASDYIAVAHGLFGDNQDYQKQADALMTEAFALASSEKSSAAPSDLFEIYARSRLTCAEGESSKAILDESIKLAEKAYGKASEEYAQALLNRALRSYSDRDYPDLKNRLNQLISLGTIDVNSRSLIADNLLFLKQVLADKDDPSEGLRLRLTRNRRALEVLLPDLTTCPLAEQLSTLRSLLQFLSKDLCAPLFSKDTVVEGYSQLLNYKGLPIDWMTEQSRIEKNPNALLATTVKELQSARAEAANSFSQSPEKLSLLSTRIESLERKIQQLNRGSVGSLEQLYSLSTLQSSLAEDELLLDLYTLQPQDQNEMHYIAVLVTHSGLPTVLDLGSRDTIDKQIQPWMSFLHSPHSRARSTRDVHIDSSEQKETSLPSLSIREIIGDAVKKLPKASHIFVCPDGMLATLPWSFLLSGERTNLFVTQVDSPRQITRFKTSDNKIAATEDNEILLTGISTFPDAPALPGTQVEITKLSALGSNNHRKVIVLPSNSLTKESLMKQITSTSEIHIATHGFCLADSSPVSPALQTRANRSFDMSQAMKIFAQNNPLVQSGLLLSPSTEHPEHSTKLTAEEILGMNLSKCRLVTLSACETGRGETFTGQGVMGLRTAIIASGCSTLLASLWNVDDEATVQLMLAFYTNMWKKNLPAAGALKQAQSEIQHANPAWKDPYYWAGWEIVGKGW